MRAENKLLRTRMQDNRIRHHFGLDRKAVSEALGTILLLAVSIVLVSAMFVWTQTIPKLDEGKSVNFITGYDDGNLSITHVGGDHLLNSETELRLIIDGSARNFSIDTDPVVGSDNIWMVGETWRLWLFDPSKPLVSQLETLEVLIIDTHTQTVVFRDELFTEAVDLNLPDLSVQPDNITFQFPGNQIRRGIWTNITVQVANYGTVDVTNAVVRIFAGSSVITKDGAGQQLLDVPAKSNVAVWVNWTPEKWGLQTIFVKVYSGFSELDYSNNYALKQVVVDIPTSIIHGPDLQMTTWDILMFPENPTRGDDVKLTVIVHNLGDEDVSSGEGATLIVRDTQITWNTTTDRANYRDGVFLNETFDNISVPASGIVQKSFVWTARPGGNVTINAYIDVDNRVIETEDNAGALEFNNLASRTYRVLPKILLVDDDNVTSGEFDSASKLRQAMIAAGASFDMYFVTGLDDPKYDFGSKQLKDYDIIVWSTGYQNENSLTDANIEALKRAIANGSYLWVVGQDIPAEVSNREGDADGDPDPGEFVHDYLGIDEFTTPAGGTPEIVEGISGNPISNGLRLNLSSVFTAEDRGINVSAFKSDSATDRIAGLFYNESALGKNGNTSLYYYNVSRDFKSVYFGNDFSAINNPVERAQVAFKVLKWLNWTLTFGTDFAVAEETFSKAEPNYLDKVWINATILNNGPDEENVTVAFYVTGPDGVERLIQQYPDFQKNPYPVVIPGEGGRIHVSKQWLAQEVGAHNFRVMVDPFDAHTEISEENNDITYSDLNTRLDVAFAILVVDDDNSTNNGGDDINTVDYVTDAIDILGYDYDVHVVPGGITENAGPDVEIMKHYKAVIWLSGTALNHTLNETDQLEIGKYLDGDYEEASYITNLLVNFLMIGTDVIEDLNGTGTDVDIPSGSFLETYFKIDRYTTGAGLAGKVNGITDHRVTHGLDYQLAFTGPAVTAVPTTDKLVPTSDAVGFLYYDSKKNSYNSVSFNNSDYQLIYLPWAFSAIEESNLSTETNRSELIFLILNWFGYPESRTELRTFSVDIELNDDNPVIGYSYVIRTNVFNYGGTETSAIVRYYDKETIIDTQTIYIPANGNSTSEIIWVPLFAGNRTINVRVDAANDVPEVFEYLNNNATRPNEEVFFFYDDMEKGTQQWYHESVIYRIRGESPLDYMDNPVFTEINGTWDEVDGFVDYYDDFHSSNSSFFGSEPDDLVGNADVLLGLVIDDSRSMYQRYDSEGNTWLSRAKLAAKYLVAQISDASKVCIWDFKGSSANQVIELTELDSTGRPTVNTAIDDMDNPPGQTILWDAIGEAYTEVKGAVASNTNLVPAIVVLSDGADYASSDTSSIQSQKIEAGSRSWAPWHNMSDGSKTYGGHKGKYSLPFDTNPGKWYSAGGGSFVGTRKGLLYSDIRMYTIGLGLEHHDPEDEPVTSTYPGNGVSDNNATYSGEIESGTTEFNLWRLAETSNGTYFHAPDSDDLNGIFGQIAKALNALLARGTETRALDIGAETKYGLTGEFSLMGMDSAKLTFYHKYKLQLGYNGALARIGTYNASGQWAFKYVQPTQLYNSNMNLKRLETDDFGIPMLWGWNGVSGNNMFDWEYAEFDLSDFIGEPRVRANFTLVLYGGGSGGGWWVDDVEVKVTRLNTNPVSVSSRDQWEWTSSDSHSGDYSWWNHNATTGYLTGGLDNSLYTRSIDLTKARNVTLTAYMKFNINASTGRPPDGFRIEVTDDNGLTWKPVNLGVRVTWGVSGSENDLSDGVQDGKSPTGLDPDNDDWVEAGTLTRLSTDLSGWRGKIIKLRFRVVTSSDDNPYWGGAHYEDAGAGFGGLYIDDIIIYGESIEAEYESVRTVDLEKPVRNPGNAVYESSISVEEPTPDISESSGSGTVPFPGSGNGINLPPVNQPAPEQPGSENTGDRHSSSSPVTSDLLTSFGAVILMFIIITIIIKANISRR